MSDREKELLSLLARISNRQRETEAERKRLGEAAINVFDGNQEKIEKLKLKAAHGDTKAQDAYLAALRGRKALGSIRQDGDETS